MSDLLTSKFTGRGRRLETAKHGITKPGDTISNGYNSWILAPNQAYRMWETANFAWVHIPNAVDIHGNILPQTLFKY